jgi:hypothetical protein
MLYIVKSGEVRCDAFAGQLSLLDNRTTYS